MTAINSLSLSQAKKKADPAETAQQFAKFKHHLRLPLFELDLAAEYAQRNDL